MTGFYEDTTGSQAPVPHTLDTHTDVNISQVQDNDTLRYDATAGVWYNLQPSAGNTEINLDDITDVNAATPTEGDVIAWSDTSSAWVASAQTGGGGSGTLAGLTDTDIQLPGTDQYLMYLEGTGWVNQDLILPRDTFVGDFQGDSTLNITYPGSASSGGYINFQPTDAGADADWTLFTRADFPNLYIRRTLTTSAGQATWSFGDDEYFRIPSLNTQPRDGTHNGIAFLQADGVTDSFVIRQIDTGLGYDELQIFDLNGTDTSISIGDFNSGLLQFKDNNISFDFGTVNFKDNTSVVGTTVNAEFKNITGVDRVYVGGPNKTPLAPENCYLEIQDDVNLVIKSGVNIGGSEMKFANTDYVGEAGIIANCYIQSPDFREVAAFNVNDIRDDQMISRRSLRRFMLLILGALNTPQNKIDEIETLLTGN